MVTVYQRHMRCLRAPHTVPVLSSLSYFLLLKIDNGGWTSLWTRSMRYSRASMRSMTKNETGCSAPCMTTLPGGSIGTVGWSLYSLSTMASFTVVNLVIG